MPKEEQIKRLQKVNELIRFIVTDSDERRPPFKPKGISQFEFSEGGKLFFRDGYTNDLIYPYRNSKRHGFCEGGTIWELVLEMRKFIIEGIEISFGNLYSTAWGWYAEDRDAVIEKAKELGYLTDEAELFSAYVKRLNKSGNNWMTTYVRWKNKGAEEKCSTT